jgi:hypothetical protein
MAERQGIYFDLNEADYHADSALGSTDIKRLLQSGPDYWWDSPLNPDYSPSQPTPQQRFGRALHKYVLEGSQAFRSLYVRRPDDLVTLTAKAKAELCPNGENVLDGEDFDRIEISAKLIAQNPDLASAFEGGVPEVSVFWDASGIRCKARFDYLKPRGIGDLKSIRNWTGRSFDEACRRAIVDYRYDLQAEHYLQGRTQIPELVSDKKVYGDHDPAWLQRVVAAERFAFQWIFFQAEGAPISWSCSLSPGSAILEIAARDRQQAFAIYRHYQQQFKPGEMWLLQDPVSELQLADMPNWYK